MSWERRRSGAPGGGSVAVSTGAAVAAVLVVLAVLAGGLAGCSGSGAGLRAVPTTAAPSTPTTSAPGGTGGFVVQPPRWVSCRGATGPTGYQCATLMIPRDPLHPASGLIGMGLDRRPATGAKLGTLITNPGGPGASGVSSLPDIVSTMPKDLLARFDVVGFDPPGVARTAPVVCLDSNALGQYFHADPAPTSSAGVNALLAVDRTFADGCQARSGAELPYVNTIDAARDMDFLRQAVGDSKLTYLGYSYGTLLGATYASLYPGRVRAMVLDGAIDPAVPTIAYLDQQAAGLDGQLRQVFASCSANPKCPWKPSSDPAAAFAALLARVRSSPLPVQKSTRTVGPSELLYGTAVTLYSTDTWIDLEYSLQDAASGDGTDFLELFDAYTGRHADGSYDNLFEANAAINCTDTPALSLSSIQAALPAAEAAAPVFGAQNLYSEAECVTWPVPADGRVGPIHAPGSPPIVVIGSTGDPITPYAWAQGLASELAHGVLLTRVGDGHTAYRSSACIRSAVDSYLETTAPPAAGTRCPTN